MCCDAYAYVSVSGVSGAIVDGDSLGRCSDGSGELAETCASAWSAAEQSLNLVPADLLELNPHVLDLVHVLDTGLGFVFIGDI